MSDPFAALGLAPALVRAVADQGYTQPTPIQIEAIPVILAGRDVLAGAQTGTGKTAGFALPMLQRLEHHAHHGGRHAVRALVLTPTRELAAQVEEAIRAYGAHLKLRTALVYGGVGFNPQAEALERGVDILVATPGRLLDHVGQETVNLSHVEILVLDEADRMLDMGFIHDIRRVLALLPPKRQNLLFSATFSDEIRELAHGLLQDPVTVQVARRNAESELVNQHVYQVAQGHKRAALAHLVRSGDWHQVLVFTRTKHGANRLAEQLCRDGIESTAIHGNKSQGARTRALAGFKSGDVRVLVATDLAARGLDIEELPHVVVYDLPHVAEDYVHRIGRTGRAGATGESIALVAPEEEGLLTQIEKLLGRKLAREAVPGFDPSTLPPPPPRPEQQPQGAGERAPQERQGQHDRQGRGRRQGQRRGERDRPAGPRPPQQPQPARQGQGRPPPAQPPRQQPAPPPAKESYDDERQPTSHENSLFPSSGDAFTPAPGPRRDRNARRDRQQQQVPALLRGTPRRNG